ncbi:sensor histidine kinase [Actinoplanes missouriensis]|uniref:sensor histidine kinase n=1 Tax=Actinoplanes missouriensis TaxID=1866 RepID=UPI00155DBC3E|nr:histidine kinase [Actinoplanes missouriensis]
MSVKRSDVAVAVAFAVFALFEEFTIRMPGGWWPYALAGFTLLILFRRRIPVLAMVANALAATQVFYVEATIADERTVNFRLWQVVSMMIISYTVGRERPSDKRGIAAVAFTFAMYFGFNPGDPMADIFFPIAPYLLGLGVAAQARRSAESARVLADLRGQQAHDAVMEERVRIARELHDMVAHSVTVMVIQAGVVRRRMEAGLDVDHDLLRSIESGGRDAVGELRRTLGLLRGEESGEESGVTVLPPAGMDRLDELIAQVREAGLTVTVRREGTPAPLLPAVDLSAYRIVQEALTNVLKHAGPVRVTVGIAYRGDGVHLSVVNDGPVAAAPAGGGQGLIGMRERAALFGGELTAGPCPGGGFAITARLPR